MLSILLDILFPKHCLNCNKTGQYICKDCELFMAETNNSENYISFWEYNGIVKKAIKEIEKGAYDIVKELINKKDFKIREDTVITFVPVDIKEKKKRGFNQAEIIAREIGKKTNLPVKALKNLTQEKNILLVNDVSITGTTMLKHLNILYEAGYRNIQCFTLARAV